MVLTRLVTKSKKRLLLFKWLGHQGAGGSLHSVVRSLLSKSLVRNGLVPCRVKKVSGIVKVGLVLDKFDTPIPYYDLIDTARDEPIPDK